MGESISRKLTQEAGLLGLANWLDAGVRDALVVRINPTLQSVQELRSFQRRIRIQLNAVLAIGIGEHPEHTITVPSGEAWRILWIKIIHTDSPGGLNYFLRVQREAPTTESIVLVEKQINENLEVSLYPGRQISITPTNDEYTHAGQLELFAGDTITIFSDPFAAAGRTSLMGIRYELVPPPNEFALGPAWTGTVVP